MTIFFFLLLSIFPSSIFSLRLENFTKLPLPPGVTYPTSITFRGLGISPHTGVRDGEVLRYDFLLKAFVSYGFTSPNRNNSYCDGESDPNKLPTCGLPFGLGFGPFTGNLYVLDAYYGVGAIGPLGGQAKILLPTNNGIPYNLLVPLDVDSHEIVRFADASAIITPGKLVRGTPIPSTDSTGKVYEYNPFTKQVKPLLTNLYGPLGIATDSHATFLLISENAGQRISKYFLKGEKAGTSEILLNLTGRPDKIKRNSEGNFWIIVNIFENNGTVLPQAIKIDSSGKILATANLGNEYKQRLTVAQENGGKLYIGGPQYTRMWAFMTSPIEFEVFYISKVQMLALLSDLLDLSKSPYK